MNQIQESEAQQTIYNQKCLAILQASAKHGLELEVVYSAFKHKEEFSKASILECLQVGADEWDV